MAADGWIRFDDHQIDKTPDPTTGSVYRTRKYKASEEVVHVNSPFLLVYQLRLKQEAAPLEGSHDQVAVVTVEAASSPVCRSPDYSAQAVSRYVKYKE